MGKLKQNSLNKCMGILEDFIGNSTGNDKQKGVAMLALRQLHMITAGAGSTTSDTNQATSTPDPTCTSRPRADLTPSI